MKDPAEQRFLVLFVEAEIGFVPVGSLLPRLAQFAFGPRRPDIRLVGDV